MVKTFVGLSLMVTLLSFSAVAHAEEQLMPSWPNQRANHQAVIDDKTAAYKARGDAYVDHLYMTGGETQMEAETGALFNSEVEPVPININDVVNMIDQGGVVASDTGAAPDASADVSIQ